MLLTLTTTYTPATDLGYLLHKHPGRYQTFSLSFGKAHVFFPQADRERCTAALLVEVDAIALARSRRKIAHGFSLHPYVNDRPYVASSFLSVALGKVFGSALAGRSRERPQLAAQAIPLSARVAVIPDASRGELIHRLFQPLGYTVSVQSHPLEPAIPAWGESHYFTLELTATIPLSLLLNHLYVLLPVLDDNKHYWVDQDEVEKLLKRGEGWLAEHPERDLIIHRYLKRQKSLTRTLMQLLGDDASLASSMDQENEDADPERPLSLHQQRLDAVFQVLKASGARRVLDLGCGEGRLLERLLQDPQFVEIVGLDVSHHALQWARRRLRLEELPPSQRQRIRLLHGSLTYKDDRLKGFDAAAVVEVIEHLDPARLRAFEQALFHHARPKLVALTTPNREYNVRFPGLAPGALRHGSHRFEWTREEFQQWARKAASTWGYRVDFAAIGPEDPEVGAPSQMGVFRL